MKIFSPYTRWEQMWGLIEKNLIENPDVLRVPQEQALLKTKYRVVNETDEKKKLVRGGRPKIFSICTGGGKSIMILLHGIYLCARIEQELRNEGIERPIRFLIVCPNLNILKNNFEALDEAREYGIIPEEVYHEIRRTKGRDGDVTTVESVDYAILNFQKIGKKKQGRMLPQFEADTFDVIIIDEAHHYNENSDNVDTTHIHIAEYFKDAYKLLFTATPYQSLMNKNKDGDFEIPPLLPDFDNKNDVIYDYNFKLAWQDGYVKHPELIKVEPHEQKIIHQTPEGKIEELELYSKEMVKRFAEKHGDKYKSALGRSEKVWVNLMAATVDKLQERNKEIPQHNTALIVFRTNSECSKAKRIFDDFFKDIGFKTIIVNSSLSNKEVEKRIKEIKEDKYDVVFAVQMFNEGFNYKNFNIITFCRSVKSILLFQQLFGRSVRARSDAYGKRINTNNIEKPPVDIAIAIVNKQSHISESLWDMFMSFDWKNVREGEKECPPHNWVDFDERWYVCTICGRFKSKFPKEPPTRNPSINIDTEKIGDSDFISGVGDPRSIQVRAKTQRMLNAFKRNLKNKDIKVDEIFEMQNIFNDIYELTEEDEKKDFVRRIWKLSKTEITKNEATLIEEIENKDPVDVIDDNLRNFKKLLDKNIGIMMKKENLSYRFDILIRESYMTLKRVYGYNFRKAINTDDKEKKKNHKEFIRNDVPKITKKFKDYDSFYNIIGKKAIQGVRNKDADEITMPKTQSVNQYFEGKEVDENGK